MCSYRILVIQVSTGFAKNFTYSASGLGDSSLLVVVDVPGDGVATISAVRVAHPCMAVGLRLFVCASCRSPSARTGHSVEHLPPTFGPSWIHVSLTQFATDVAGNEDDTPSTLRVAVGQPPVTALLTVPAATSSARSFVLQAAVGGFRQDAPFVNPTIFSPVLRVFATRPLCPEWTSAPSPPGPPLPPLSPGGPSGAWTAAWLCIRKRGRAGPSGCQPPRVRVHQWHHL
jgi:hypothetical protein